MLSDASLVGAGYCCMHLAAALCAELESWLYTDVLLCVSRR